MLGTVFDDVLLAARQGAGWAVTRLYEDLAGQVTGYLRRSGCAEPDDVASETFLRVFTSLDSFEGDESGWRAWVFTIARRRMIDEQRRAGRRPRTTPLEEAAQQAGPGAVEDTLLAAVDRERLDELLGALTDAQRDVVLLRVIAGLDAREVGDVTGRSPEAVRQLQHRGLRALAEALDPD